MSTPLRLDDLRRAWDARDPELVPLIEALAAQPDELTAEPVREGVPTFDRFLAEIRGPRFSQKTPAEREHFRVEYLKALESPAAEVALPDRLRLDEILLPLWNDDSPFARACLLRAIATVPLVYGPWRALKRIFKEAEARGDLEVYGALAARFDVAFAQGHQPIGQRTLAYLVRRAWRTLRQTAVRLPVAYADAAAAVLAHYPEGVRWAGTWVANHLFYHESRAYNRRRFTFRAPPADLLTNRAFADLWRRSPRPLFGLLERAQCEKVRAFAADALRADFRAALRDVELAWVARLVAVGSRAVDEFIVWVLKNVPRFEQGAFRDLGLHAAVLRLLDSLLPDAQTYAAEYARTHARDLPVPELVRLVDNTSPAVRKLALDLLQGRDPRNEIGLDAWGRLLETRHGHALAAAALRKHFGARELTPAWFKGRLFTPSHEAFEFVRKLLLEVHPPQKLGPGFFVDLVDAIGAPGTPDDQLAAETVAEFAVGELTNFDVNALDRDVLQRLMLSPYTREAVSEWVDEGRLKLATLNLSFLKALAFHPAWETDPWLAALRQGDRDWARRLEFDEAVADQVLGWLGDVRRIAPADLGFDWLMQLVDRGEPRYHTFAVETMIKAFVPADFAPREAAPTTPAAAPVTIHLGGASFVFTGKMATMPRKDAEAAAKQAGGTVASAVTKKLHYLVIGDEGSPLYSGGKKGDKQQKAEQLNAAGANIRIISETAFLQMLAGGAKPAASADATLAGCEQLWRMAVGPGAAAARRGEFARKYLLRHHPEIGPALTDRPVDPGAEVPREFLTFTRVEPLFAETRKPLRDFALELAKYEFARWDPPAEALLALSELPHADVRRFVAEALLADDDPEKRRYRINPDALRPEAVYRFCESTDADTRQLGMRLIQRSPRLQVPEEMFRLTESPDRVVRGFVIRSVWALYRERGVTEGWQPPAPPASTLRPAAEPAARGPGVPARPEKPPADAASLTGFLRRVLFEVPPGRPDRSPTDEGEAEPTAATRRLKPLPAREAKLELIAVLRDLALEDAAFAAHALPLLEEFLASRGASEWAACLVAVTRIRHAHSALAVGPEARP